MKLTVYPLGPAPPKLQAAKPRREWMDATPSQFAYRCLPLVIANAHGWQVINMRRFSAEWTGAPDTGAISIRKSAERAPPGHAELTPLSHFGSGVLTFEMPMLVETEPGWNLAVQGPVNRPKDGIAPLSAIVETDWSPYSFTMNWIFTRAFHKVRFEVGEPVCQIFPVQRGALERVEPAFGDLRGQQEKFAQYETWRVSRTGFLEALPDPESEAARQKWQRGYFRGTLPDGTPGPADHQTKLKLREFPD